ncbi:MULTISPECIES: AAA family ATPase [unclassified Psychrobacter]|uniref:McrB family protein n=1 Tax=unclassified Psychrobacter TaxID=196806 RepID=UPI0025B34E97|nr:MULTISPECIES: AAA family ATPase [unclassified Psychrobacter]MDN3453031.1 AAA family ATPase [Psychrobacter sp. APC 3350]MDN3501405.1 AAA family ATPase [Psychrobacter sp. 5A.1]
MPDMSTHEPTNLIYTGVAGTGKTYRLLQIAKQYTDHLPKMDDEDLLGQLLQGLSWREVVCLIFLDFQSKKQDLVKVPELVNHEFFTKKATQNDREKNLSNTAWSVLQMHCSITSETVSYKNRASQAYFDKDNSGAWYLLPESMGLLQDLSQELAEFQQAQHDNQHHHNQMLGQQRFSMVSFHQAYGYEEFVEGIRPVMSGAAQANNSPSNQTQMSYAVQDGAFLKLCQRAARDPQQRYAMLIDEINRANVSRVFGELLSLIEPDKRAGKPNAMTVNLAYSGRAFSVPANVDIYATMNTQDHSLAPLDMALRRRFRFIDCPPQPDLLSIIVDASSDSSDDNTSATDRSEAATIDLSKLLSGLNRRIAQTLGVEAQLGHAFLFTVSRLEQLQTALIEQIIPQLAQAAGGQVAVLQYIFGDDQQPTNKQFIQDSQALINDGLPHSMDNQNNGSAQHSMFAGQGSFLSQSMNMGSYTINADLIANSGEFNNAVLYQRLY